MTYLLQMMGTSVFISSIRPLSRSRRIFSALFRNSLEELYLGGNCGNFVFLPSFVFLDISKKSTFSVKDWLLTIRVFCFMLNRSHWLTSGKLARAIEIFAIPFANLSVSNKVFATDSRDTGKHTHAIHDMIWWGICLISMSLTICLRVYCACAIV